MLASVVPHLAGQIALYARNRMSFFVHEADLGNQSVMGDVLRSSPLKDEENEAIAFYPENIVGKR